MSILSKFFTSIGYLISILFPFFFVFLTLSFISIFLFQKNIVSASSIILLSFSSFVTLLSLALLFLIILITLFLPSIYLYTRIPIYIVLAIVFFSLTAQQLSIIKSFTEFANIKARWVPCGNPRNIIESISCFFTGYMPSQATGNWEAILIVYGFWLYAFVIPLIVLFHLMNDFINSSGVIQNETYRNIISIGFTFLVYRGFLITKLIDFLYIGAAGAGMLILNFIAINYVLKRTNKLFKKMRVMSEKELKSKSIQELKRSTKAALSRLKLIPSVNLMGIVFEDRIRNNLKTIFENENKLDVFESLVADFENARNKSDRNAMKQAIDRMIAEID